MTQSAHGGPVGLRIGARASALARWQSTFVRDSLTERHPEIDIEIIDITTDGDLDRNSPYSSLGMTGVFTKRIEVALHEQAIDLAVHSLKDLPSELASGLVLGAFLPRADPRDVLISEYGPTLSSLPDSPILATGSPRRKAQVLLQRPDAQFVDIRGNVETRLKRFRESAANGMVLAAAGLNRLGLDHHIAGFFGIDEMVPAAGQGIVVVECRESDERARELLADINQQLAMAAAVAERSFMSRVGAGCQTPVGAHAMVAPDGVTLQGVVLTHDASRWIRHSQSGDPSEARELGREVADRLIAEGAREMIAGASAGGPH